MMYDHGWRPYVSAAKRRQNAARKIARLKKSGREVKPVAIEGRTIAKTFWGASWCQNLEAYSDYESRLPRGRTYARNGSVIDLQIEAGRIHAMVSGSSFYDVKVEVKPLARKRWNEIKAQCAGKIDSMVELLQGSIARGVMELVTRRGAGLFPTPREISMRCSCPDWATLCKHAAAALYGVGARLDHEPEMLFRLRGVDPTEMIAAAVSDAPTLQKNGRRRLLNADDVSSVFGIELSVEPAADASANRATPAKLEGDATNARMGLGKKAVKKKAVANKARRKKSGTKKAVKKKAVANKATRKKSGTKKGVANKARRSKKAVKKKAVKRRVVKRRAVTKKAGTRKATRAGDARKA